MVDITIPKDSKMTHGNHPVTKLVVTFELGKAPDLIEEWVREKRDAAQIEYAKDNEPKSIELGAYVANHSHESPGKWHVHTNPRKFTPLGGGRLVLAGEFDYSDEENWGLEKIIDLLATYEAYRTAKPDHLIKAWQDAGAAPNLISIGLGPEGFEI